MRSSAQRTSSSAHCTAGRRHGRQSPEWGFDDRHSAKLDQPAALVKQRLTLRSAPSAPARGRPPLVVDGFAPVGGSSAHLGDSSTHVGEWFTHPGELLTHVGESSTHLGESYTHVGEWFTHPGELLTHVGESSTHVGESYTQLGERLTPVGE